MISSIIQAHFIKIQPNMSEQEKIAQESIIFLTSTPSQFFFLSIVHKTKKKIHKNSF